MTLKCALSTLVAPIYFLALGAILVLILSLMSGWLHGWWPWALAIALSGVLLVAGLIGTSLSDERERDQVRRELALPPGVSIDTPPPPDDRTAAPAESGLMEPTHQVPASDPIATIAGRTPVEAVAFCPTRPFLAQGLAGGNVALWNIGTASQPNPVVTLRPDSPTDRHQRTAVAFHPGGHLLATGGADGALWDLTAPRSPRRLARLFLPEHAHTVAAVAFNGDGRLLATSSDRGQRLNLWDVTTPVAPRRIAILARPPKRVNVGAFWRPGPVCGAAPAAALAFHPTRALLAASVYDWAGRHVVRLWDLTDPGRPRRYGDVPLYQRSRWNAPMDTTTVHDLAISPNGGLLATASQTNASVSSEYGSTHWREAEVGLWALSDLTRPERIAGLRERGTLDVALRHAFRGRSQRQADRLARSLTGHAGLARAVAFHPRRPLLASAGDDATLLWDLTISYQPRPEATLSHRSPPHALAFHPGGHILAATSATTTLWPIT